jgi:hypothetical protein
MDTIPIQTAILHSQRVNSPRPQISLAINAMNEMRLPTGYVLLNRSPEMVKFVKTQSGAQEDATYISVFQCEDLTRLVLSPIPDPAKIDIKHVMQQACDVEQSIVREYTLSARTITIITRVDKKKPKEIFRAQIQKLVSTIFFAIAYRPDAHVAM